MTRALVNSICATFPGAEVSDPWGGDPDELRHRLGVSYDIVRAGLTKKLQATLEPRG